MKKFFENLLNPTIRYANNRIKVTSKSAVTIQTDVDPNVEISLPAIAETHKKEILNHIYGDIPKLVYKLAYYAKGQSGINPEDLMCVNNLLNEINEICNGE